MQSSVKVVIPKFFVKNSFYSKIKFFLMTEQAYRYPVIRFKDLLALTGPRIANTPPQILLSQKPSLRTHIQNVNESIEPE